LKIHKLWLKGQVSSRKTTKYSECEKCPARRRFSASRNSEISSIAGRDIIENSC
jgi:hypothetical protein